MKARFLTRHNALWMLLIAAVLMMRAMVPQGWMPDVSAHSLFAIKPCPTQFVLPEAPVQMSGHHHHTEMPDAGSPIDHSDHSEHFAGEPCALSGFGMPALAGEDFAEVSAPLVGPEAFDRSQSDAIVLARRRTLPPARAPPLSV
jgi:hypothetical protein